MESGKAIISGGPLESVPHVSLGRIVLDRLRQHEKSTLSVDAKTGQVVTCRDMLEATVKLASFFTKYGIKVGDRIAIMTENRLNFLLPACATWYVGGVVTPYSVFYTKYELVPLITNTRPRIMFVSRRTEQLLVEILPTLPWRMDLITLDNVSLTKGVPTVNSILDKESGLVNADTYKATEIIDIGRQPAVILCSSGTTGLPKGVVLSHRNLLVFMATVRSEQFLNVIKGDRILLYLPFHHGYAFGLLLISLYCGAQSVTMQSFDQELFLGSIERYRVTHLPLVPSVLLFLTKHPLVTKYDFRSVRIAICGAAPFPKELFADVRSRLKIPDIRNGYGMTELSIIMLLSGREDVNGDLNTLVPGAICKIADPETGKTLGRNQIGEIHCKGDIVMIGYYGNREATQSTIDADGWLRSGDLGYIDDNGTVHVDGRLKELIKYKGYQVSPAELEMILLMHPAVKDAAIVGKPDEVSGELPMALVVKQPGTNPSASEIVQFVNEKVSPQKRLRAGVRFVETIPKNPTGKILRRELQAMLSKL